MKSIPKEILDRITFHSSSHTIHAEPVKHIDPILRDCEDCGALCDRRQTALFSTTPYPHWKHRCDTCHKFRNPQTGRYDLPSSVAVNRVLRAIKSQDDK